MTDLPGRELDAAVMTALGWTHIGKWENGDAHQVGCPPDFVCGLTVVDGKVKPRTEPIPDSIYERYRIGEKGGTIAWVPKVSTDDAEAVRLCLPWLKSKAHKGKVILIESDVESCTHLGVSVAGTLRPITENGDTLAESMCLAVLAVVDRLTPVLAVSEKEQADGRK